MADMLNKNNDEKNAKALFEQVINAIQNKNKEAAKALFSQKALADTDEFEENLDYLFGFVQGEIITWEKIPGSSVYEWINYGQKKKEVSSGYYVNTEMQKYYFSLIDYPVDTENPDNVGLYMLLVVRAEDREKIYDENNKIIYDKIIENGEEKLVKLQHAGVYLPLK